MPKIASKIEPTYTGPVVDADRLDGIVPVLNGGTGTTNLSDLKTSLALNNVNNTSDINKPVSTAQANAITTALQTNLDNFNTVLGQTQTARDEALNYGSAIVKYNWYEAEALTGLSNNAGVIVLSSDTGTHVSVSGDYGSVSNQTPNSGFYQWSSLLGKLVRRSDLESTLINILKEQISLSETRVEAFASAVTTTLDNYLSETIAEGLADSEIPNNSFFPVVTAEGRHFLVKKINSTTSGTIVEYNTVVAFEAESAIVQAVKDEALQYGAAKVVATYAEAIALSGLVNGQAVYVLSVDTGTHTSVAGDYGSVSGQTSNSGYYAYSTSLSALVKKGPLESTLVKGYRDQTKAYFDALGQMFDGYIQRTVAAGLADSTIPNNSFFPVISDDNRHYVVYKDSSGLAGQTIEYATAFSGIEAPRVRASFTVLEAMSGWTDGMYGMVTAADTGTHSSYVGDVGASGGQTPNRGHYVYSGSLSKLIRVGDLESYISNINKNTTEAHVQALGTIFDGFIYQTVAEGLADPEVPDGTFFPVISADNKRYDVLKVNSTTAGQTIEYQTSLAIPEGASMVGIKQSSIALPEYLDKVVRRIGFYPQSYGAEADGVTDDSAAIRTANDEAEAANGKLVWEGDYLFKSQLQFSVPIEVVAGSKGIVAEDFVGISGGITTINNSAIINKYNGLYFNPSTARPFSIIGSRLELEVRSTTPRQLLTLCNVNGGEINEPFFWTNTTARVDALIDFYASCRDIDIWSPELWNITGASGGGETWVRNITSDGSNPENDTYGIRFHGGRFRHATGDESAAIFGVKGKTRGIRFYDTVIEALIAYTTGSRHSTLLSAFPLNLGGSGTVAQGDLYAAVEDVIFDGVTLNDARFLDHVYRTGRTEDKFNTCRDVLLTNAIVKAKQQTVRTSHMVRHIPCVGSNVVIDNITATADTGGQVITFGALGFDSVSHSEITGHITYGVSGCQRVVENKKIVAESYAVDDCPIVEMNSNITAPNFPVQIRGTQRYSIARNKINSTATTGSAAAVLVNSLGGATTPSGVIEQNDYNGNNNSSASLVVTSGTPGVIDVLRNNGVGTGSSTLPSSLRRVEGNNRFGTPDPDKQVVPGDADVTLTASGRQSVIYNTPLTAIRTITAPSSGVIDGHRFIVRRTANATGAFNVTFSGNSLSDTGWMEFERISGAWIKVGQGV